MQRKQILVRAVSALIFFAGISTGAEAQKAGTYSGTSVDGGNISLSVTGTSPNFTITSMNVNFDAN